MKSWKKLVGALLSFILPVVVVLTQSPSYAQPEKRVFIQVQAKDKFQRSAIVNRGVSIEFVVSDAVWGFATPSMIAALKKDGFQILGTFDESVARGGHETGGGALDFPGEDERFHNYAELTAAIKQLAEKHSDIARVHSIGKSLEGRDVWAIQINSTPESLQKGSSNKPGAIYLGTHHAREHVSTEIPLMMAQYLLENRKGNDRVANLVDTRDIWIVPMVNPDGVEHDIKTGNYKMWRKNRRANGDGTYGVDLNRNYGYMWGTGGSSKNTNSDVYMGTAPFSEPETQNIREFVNAHLNAKVLISFHTFSELILYPWGHTHDPVSRGEDRAVFTKMANTMAQWNKYTPQSAADLYIASGDTVDWAYGEHGIFAFTFELSPKSMWDGGFYPGAGVIDKVFKDNLAPFLYTLEVANDPYKVTKEKKPSYLDHLGL